MTAAARMLPAGTADRPEAELVTALRDDPRSFSLLQAVRILAAAGIAVRFRPALHLAFPSAEVESIRVFPGPTPVYEITTPILGIYGPNSPLPAFISEFLLHHDEAGRARHFLDRCNHRIVELFAEACSKYRQSGSGSAVTSRLIALLGLRPRSAIDLSPYAGILLSQPVSAAGIETILRDHVHPVPVSIEQCTPRWTSLPVSAGALLGTSRLGTDSVAGDSVWSRTTSFRIRIGPVPASDLGRFQPGGSAARAIAEIVARCNPDSLDWDLELIVDGAEMPAVALGSTAQLGWSMRLDGPASAEYRIICPEPSRPAA
ncbi:MAG: type VI secretion system baseplate subunit TssG [Planctomycetes bacterium]|nr:type VI secretion system baseplate subunit TssG [Planctomycetota bacterium]